MNNIYDEGPSINYVTRGRDFFFPEFKKLPDRHEGENFSLSDDMVNMMR